MKRMTNWYEVSGVAPADAGVAFPHLLKRVVTQRKVPEAKHELRAMFANCIIVRRLTKFELARAIKASEKAVQTR